jgi:Na+/proline symporter
LEVESEHWKIDVGGECLKFKAEMCLLMAAIVLFGLSAFLYSYQPSTETLTYSIVAGFPYRIQALMFVGFGSALMLTASISYSRRSKNFVTNSRRV